MSKNRKPLSEQTGNLTTAYKEQRKLEEALATGDKSELNIPPDWLIDESAVNEWCRVVNEFQKIGMLCNLDIDSLGGFCNAFALYKKATMELGENGLIDENGENPYIKLQLKYAQEMRAFAALCGLTIDSRLKFAAQKAQDINTEIEDTFGDI